MRVTYAPRNNCKRLLEDRAPELLLSGPAGTGKSRACLQKMHFVALKYPGSRQLMLRKTAVSLTSTALVTWREHVVKEALESGLISYYGGSAVEPAQYRYPNGSTIMIGGMDNSTRIMSSEYDLIYVQEAIELSEDEWEKCVTRLRNQRMPYQQIIADTNPDTPTHWLKKRCDVGKTVMLDTTHEDNPVYFTADGRVTAAGEDYISKLDGLTGVRYQRLRKGLWVAAEGVIYEDFSQGHHVVDRFDVPSDWVRYWAIDFGFTNPFVCQFWAEDPDGRLYLYREIYKSGVGVDIHAQRILALVTDSDGVWTEPKPAQIITDHDAGERNILERALNMRTTAANKNVAGGIQATQARMKRAGDGKARLFLMRNSTVEVDKKLLDAKKPISTLEEIPGYVWDPGSRNNPAVKETPLKLNDHGCDAMRYMVAHKDMGSTYRVRFA